jgi:hypothetical protein
MKFKFLKIVLTGLIVLASTSIKIVHARPPAPIISEAPIISVFEWEATCYDCKGELGMDTGDNYSTVNAILTLKNLDSIENGWWDPTNFVSLAYTADSDHVYDFIVDGASDQFQYAYGTIPNIDLFYFWIEWNDYADNVEKALGASNTNRHTYKFDVSFDREHSVDSWSVSSTGNSNDPFETYEQVDLDYGVNIHAKTSTSPQINASAPSSILIFALGLMGLSLRRSKKQV